MKYQCLIILLLFIVFFVFTELNSQSVQDDLVLSDKSFEEFILPRSQIIFELDSEFLQDWMQITSPINYPKSITFLEKSNTVDKSKIILRDFDGLNEIDIEKLINKQAEEAGYILSTDENQQIEGKKIRYLMFQNNEQKILASYLLELENEIIAIEFQTTFNKFGLTEQPLAQVLKAVKNPKNKLLNREILQLSNNVDLILPKGYKFVNKPKNQVVLAENRELKLHAICFRNLESSLKAASQIETILVKKKEFHRKSAESKRLNKSEILIFHGTSADNKLMSLCTVKNEKNYINLLAEYSDFETSKLILEKIIADLKFKEVEKTIPAKVQPSVFFIDENDDGNPDFIEINLIFIDKKMRVLSNNLPICDLLVEITDFEKNKIFALSNVRLRNYKDCILGGEIAKKLRFQMNWLQKFKDSQYVINISANFGSKLIKYKSRMIDILAD